MKFRRELLLMILVNTVAAGCAGDPVVGSFTVDTLATGTVVVHNSDDGMWSDGEVWILNTDLRNEGQDCFVLKRANDELAFDVFGPKRNWRKRKRGRKQKEETPDNQR